MYHSHTRSKVLKAIDESKAGAWLNVVEPSEDELTLLAQMYKLDADLLHDAIDPYESPRVEREDDSVYVYTRYAYPDNGVNATEPLLIIYHPEVLITIARSNPPVLHRLISYSIPVITTQKTKTLLQMLEEVNASYRREIHKVSRHILGIRNQLSKVEIKDSDFVSFIDLEEDLNEYFSALQSQASMLRNLLNGRYRN
jgi:magnesium transporter